MQKVTSSGMMENPPISHSMLLSQRGHSFSLHTLCRYLFVDFKASSGSLTGTPSGPVSYSITKDPYNNYNHKHVLAIHAGALLKLLLAVL